jgi:adenine-specific DNA-methyltransferase
VKLPNCQDNLLVWGDNLEVMRAMGSAYAQRFALAYLDPPYNTGSRKADAYDDSMGSKDWRRFFADRLLALWPLMRADGLVMIQIDERELGSVLLILEQQERRIINHVVVKMSELSGVKMNHAASRLPKLKEHLLIVAVGPSSSLCNLRLPKSPASLLRYCKYYTQVLLNPGDEVSAWKLLPVRRAAAELWGWEPAAKDAESTLLALKIEHAEQLVYRTNNAFIAADQGSGIRRLTSPQGRRYIAWDDKQMLFLSDHLDEPLGDLWSDLSTINLNKEGGVAFRHSKKPEKLLERCLQLSTQPGDWILDPFAGSGTSAAVAFKMERRFVTIELGDHAETLTRKRLDDLGEFRFLRFAP